MKKYETMFVLKPELTEESIKGIVEKIKSLIEKSGEVESVDEWGKRKLAYTIDKKYNEGYYVIVNFSAGADTLQTLEHNFKVGEEFIRHMIIKRED